MVKQYSFEADTANANNVSMMFIELKADTVMTKLKDEAKIMDKNLPKRLFDALALYSLPLERVFHLALETIKTDESISEKHRDELLTSVKAVLSNSLDIHSYLQSKDSTLDFRKEGKIEYEAIREQFRGKFPSDGDREINLHLFIEEETERRMKKDK